MRQRLHSIICSVFKPPINQTLITMKITLILFCLLFSTSMAGSLCAQDAGKAIVPARSVIKNVQTLLNHNSRYLRLKESFTAYDAGMHRMTKNAFLQKLTTGGYLPLRLESKNPAGAYQLYRLPASADRDIKILLKQIGNTYYGYTQVEGKRFPPFHFTDLNGNIYTPQNTRGKIIVLKGWFIACQYCVAEMPMLNQLTDEYRSRKDILFLSIALDSRKALQQFAKRIPFKYAIIPVAQKFMENDLHATGYPVHWIINKLGKVVDMSYNSNEMIAALRKEAVK